MWSWTRHRRTRARIPHSLGVGRQNGRGCRGLWRRGAPVNSALSGTDIAAIKASADKLAVTSQRLGSAIYGQPPDEEVVDAEIVEEGGDSDTR